MLFSVHCPDGFFQQEIYRKENDWDSQLLWEITSKKGRFIYE